MKAGDFMSKRLFIIIMLICVVISLTACTKTDAPTIPTPEEETSGIIGDVLVPDASDTTTSEPEPSEPDISETTSPANSTPAGTTSRATNPPANNTPSQAPAQPNNPTSAPSNPPTPPAKPTYTEADFQRIIDTIRAYGEAKGFVWNDSFEFGQGHGYYGRPNLERDGYDGVISRLKYHCDEMEKDIGACYFKVIKHIYQGNTEFIVLYA